MLLSVIKNLLVFVIVLQLANQVYSTTKCSASKNCAECDTSTGDCSFCPPGKGWSKGKCTTLNSPEHCLYFENPNDNTLISTICDICSNGYYRKYNGLQCEPESEVAECDGSCYACKETSTDSMTDDATGSECQLCETGYSMPSPIIHSCSSSNLSNWYECKYEGTSQGTCHQCEGTRVQYYEDTRCDLAYSKSLGNIPVNYCSIYADVLGETCTRCLEGYGQVDTTTCNSNVISGILYVLGISSLIVFSMINVGC